MGSCSVARVPFLSSLIQWFPEYSDWQGSWHLQWLKVEPSPYRVSIFSCIAFLLKMEKLWPRKKSDLFLKRKRKSGGKGKVSQSWSLWRLWGLALAEYQIHKVHLALLTFFQFSSVAQSCPTLCDPMDCSMPGLPVHHQLREPTQTHVRNIGDAIQPSHPLLSSSPPAFNFSQHQSLFKWVSSSYQVAKVLEFQLQHQSFQ